MAENLVRVPSMQVVQGAEGFDDVGWSKEADGRRLCLIIGI